MSEESIKNIGSENTFASSLIDHRPLSIAKFNGNCLRIRSISLHQKVVNFLILH